MLLVDQDLIHEQAKAHQMQDLIQDRASTIKLVSETMKNIGELTADIKEQTQL